MTPQQMVGVAVRIFAIWLAINGLQAIIMAAAMAAQRGAELTAMPYVIASAFFVGALLLWFFPMVVAHKLIPRTQFENALTLPHQEVIEVACVVLGLWVVLMRALPAVAYFISVVAFAIRNDLPLSTMDPSQTASFAAGLVQLAVGLFVILRSRTLASYIGRIAK